MLGRDDDEVGVLLVEDNPGDVRLIEQYLSRAGSGVLAERYDLLHARTLAEAFDYLDCGGETASAESDAGGAEADVMLLDLGLPGSTGLATLERVLERTDDVPIVVLTGLENREVAVQAIQVGAQDYLNKDTLDGDTLVRAIRYAIERKENELALEQTIERLDEFASVVAHDLRNPLNVAVASLDLARETGDDEHFERIDEAHARMTAIIDDVLTLARQGDVDDTGTTPLAAVAESAWQNVESLTAALDVETTARVVADDSQLTQLFENLFRNALEHGAEDATVRVGDIDGGFFVADDGPGIPADQRERVFDSGYSTRDGNTGFGLAIVERVVEAHGWEVAVTESEHGGARFEFTGVESPAPTGASVSGE
ncbi:MAG: hybrid sensor histidine kinase/response regulator [Haloferacaceae archaeon]